MFIFFVDLEWIVLNCKNLSYHLLCVMSWFCPISFTETTSRMLWSLDYLFLFNNQFSFLFQKIPCRLGFCSSYLPWPDNTSCVCKQKYFPWVCQYISSKILFQQSCIFDVNLLRLKGPQSKCTFWKQQQIFILSICVCINWRISPDKLLFMLFLHITRTPFLDPVIRNAKFFFTVYTLRSTSVVWHLKSQRTFCTFALRRQSVTYVLNLF